MGFKTELKKSRTGERRDLETLSGFYFQPVLFSVEGEDEIRAVTMKNKDLIPPTAIKRLQGKKLTPSEMVDDLTEKEMAQMIENMNANSTAAIDLMRVKIRYGFGPNNFGDGVGPEGALTGGGIPVSVVDDLLENSATAHEIVNIIDEFNSPLAVSQQEKPNSAASGSLKSKPSQKVQNGRTGQSQTR